MIGYVTVILVTGLQQMQFATFSTFFLGHHKDSRFNLETTQLSHTRPVLDFGGILTISTLLYVSILLSCLIDEMKAPPLIFLAAAVTFVLL